MPQFRSKPRVITANRYHEELAYEVPGVCICARQGPHVHTLHEGQQVRLQDGDWVVAEPDGEHYYPIKDAVLRTNYEPVEGENDAQETK